MFPMSDLCGETGLVWVQQARNLQFMWNVD